MKLNKILLVAVLAICLALPVLSQAAIDTGIGFGTVTGLTSQDVRVSVAKIIQVSLGLLGIIDLVIIVVAGFKWMLAMGNDDQVTESKSLMKNAVIGLAIILAAFSIATFVVGSLQSTIVEE